MELLKLSTASHITHYRVLYWPHEGSSCNLHTSNNGSDGKVTIVLHDTLCARKRMLTEAECFCPCYPPPTSSYYVFFGFFFGLVYNCIFSPSAYRAQSTLSFTSFVSRVICHHGYILPGNSCWQGSWGDVNDEVWQQMYFKLRWPATVTSDTWRQRLFQWCKQCLLCKVWD